MNVHNSSSRITLFGLCLVIGLFTCWQTASANGLVGGVLVGTAPPEECDPDVEGGKILDAAQRMTDATCESSSIVMNDRSGFFAQSLKSKMSEKCTRMKNWVGAEHRKADFTKMGRKNSADCYIVENDDERVGNNDGICTKNEWYDKNEDLFGCKEELGDGIGDEDEYCELIDESPNGKKKVWEKCMEACDTPQDSQALTDCTTMDLMTMSLEDAADELETANSQIEVQLAVFEAQQASKVQMVAGDLSSDFCINASSAVFEDKYFADGDRQDDYSDISAALTAALLLEQAGNTCTDAADTTVFGADWPVVCMAVHYGQQVAQSFAEQMELLDDTITGTRIDNVSLCVEQMDGKISDLKELLGDMDEKLDLIIEYLNTPQGQRPDFPGKP